MTLVLSYINPWYAVQVADRKIVLAEDGFPEYDATANKTVVYGATDGLVAVSFAGHAYIDGLPTDEWLASLLWGQPFRRGVDGIKPTLHSTGGRLHFWSVSEMMIELSNRMGSALGRRRGLELTVTGWREAEDGLLIPVLCQLEKPVGSTSVKQGDAIGYRDTTRGFEVFSTSGVGATPEDLKQYWMKFYDRRCPPSVEEAECTLIEIVRDVSRRHRGVGPHVLSIVIPRFDVAGPYSKFHPDTPHLKTTFFRGVEWEAEVAFVPWIISDIATAQSYQTDDLIHPIGPVEFRAYGSGKSGNVGFARTNPRPPPA